MPAPVMLRMTSPPCAEGSLLHPGGSSCRPVVQKLAVAVVHFSVDIRSIMAF